MIKVENNLQFKYMVQTIETKELNNKAQVLEWRNSWMEELKKWHSPYRLLIDCTKLESISEEIRSDIANMFRFYQGMHMQKAAYFGPKIDGLEQIDFLKHFPDEEKAQSFLRIKSRNKVLGADAGFRDQIQIQNHFRQQVMEVSFANPVKLDSPQKLALLKSKMSNNLMQWHSHWNLLVDCKNLEFDESLGQPFDLFIKLFKGFFLQQVKGYAPHKRKAFYPFEVRLSRHQAAAELKDSNSTKISGDTANCSDRKGLAK